MGQASLLRHVGKCPVAIVVKQVAARLRVAHCWIEAGAVDKEDVDPAVVVVIEERGAATHLLQQELLVLGTAGNVAGAEEPRSSRDISEQHRAVLTLRSGQTAGDR